MTVAAGKDGLLILSGACGSEDAEPLLRGLLASRSAAVDWRACESAHPAVIQVLLVARRPMIGPPRSPVLQRWIQPVLEAAAATGAEGALLR